MHSGTLFAALITCALFASSAAAAPTVCSQGEITRAIEVVYTNSGQAVPCEVRYDKSQEGAVQTPYRAENQQGYCEARAEGLVKRLRGLGWDCASEASGSAEAEAESDG